MFSLIITVVAIALVAVLALATLYYGGAAFGKGAARAEASKLVLQGQQLLGAADLYFTENRAWPANIDQLVDGGYLKQVPNANASGLSEAMAAGQPWSMVPNSPTFFIPTSSVDVCAEVNLSASLRKRGVLRHAYSGLVAQCYGAEASSLSTVFRKDTSMPFNNPGDVNGTVPPTDPTDPDWLVQPGADTGIPVTGPVPPLYEGPTGPVHVGLLRVDPAYYEFVVAAGSNATQQLFWTNMGAESITLQNTFSAGTDFFGSPVQVISGPGSVLRVLAADGDSCTSVIQPGQTCELLAEFAPTTQGTWQWPFVLQTSAGDVTITLRGRTPEQYVPASNDAKLTLSRTAVAIARVGGAAGQDTVQATSEGRLPVNNLSVTVVGSTAFSATENCPAALNTAASCALTVSYAPMAGQPDTATLQVSGDNVPTQTVALSVTDLAAPPAAETSPDLVVGPAGDLQFVPATLDFGTLPVGMRRDSGVALRNVGSSPVVLGNYSETGSSDIFAEEFGCTAATSEYNQVPGELQPGEECYVNVEFEPTTAGAKTLSLSITHGGAGGAATLNIGAVAVESALVMLYEGVDHGDNEIDISALFWTGPDFYQDFWMHTPLARADGSRRFQVTVVNRGTQPVTIVDVLEGGYSGAGDGVIDSTTCSGTLAARTSCSIVFMPEFIHGAGLRPDGWVGERSGAFRPRVDYVPAGGDVDAPFHVTANFVFDASAGYGLTPGEPTGGRDLGSTVSAPFTMFNWTSTPVSFSIVNAPEISSPLTLTVGCAQVPASGTCAGTANWVIERSDVSQAGSNWLFDAYATTKVGNLGTPNVEAWGWLLNEVPPPPTEPDPVRIGAGGGHRFASVDGPAYLNLENTSTANAFFSYSQFGTDCASGQSGPAGRNSCNINAMTSYYRANGHPGAVCQIETGTYQNNMGTKFTAVCRE